METQSARQSFGDLIQGDKPVLVDFSAEWCGPCKMMPPILKELKQMTGDDLIILKMDVDRNPQVANAYQIQSVPTLMVFRNGQVKWRQSGVMNARQIKGAIEQYMK